MSLGSTIYQKALQVLNDLERYVVAAVDIVSEAVVSGRFVNDANLPVADRAKGK